MPAATDAVVRLEEPASAMGALRTIRRNAGVTGYQLGPRAGLDQSHIARLEMGYSHPSLPTLFRLAHALGYDVALVPRQTRAEAA